MIDDAVYPSSRMEESKFCTFTPEKKVTQKRWFWKNIRRYHNFCTGLDKSLSSTCSINPSSGGGGSKCHMKTPSTVTALLQVVVVSSPASLHNNWSWNLGGHSIMIR